VEIVFVGKEQTKMDLLMVVVIISYLAFHMNYKNLNNPIFFRKKREKK